MEEAATFTCAKFPIPIPAALSDKFCAKRHRKARLGDPCFDCEKGISAVKEAKEMAEKKLCSCGCGKQAVKDGLAWGCYRKKHGVAPFKSSTPKKAGRQAGRQAGSVKASKGRRKGNGHECEGCKVLQMQLDELGRAEKIMVAAGLVPAEKFEQARKIVRELHG